MKLEIILPHSQWGFKMCGVYRILFEDGYFYIGGSVHLKNRASSWASAFRTQKGVPGVTMGAPMLAKIREGVAAKFEIIELCNEVDIREREAFYLDENQDNVLMLSNEKMGAWKSILQYNPEGQFVKKHFSIQSAARYVNVTLSSVQRVLAGERKTCGGAVFVYEHDYQSRRKEITARRYLRIEKKQGRDVLIIDSIGNEVGRFKTIRAAAAHLSVRVETATRGLNGQQKTVKGYFLKYGERLEKKKG